jgi:hypothetical protein
MATDYEIAQGMNGYLRSKGYTCGRLYANVPDVARSISAGLPGETPQTLEPKIRRIAKTPAFGFKTRGDSVSASDSSDPDCGRD